MSLMPCIGKAAACNEARSQETCRSAGTESFSRSRVIDCTDAALHYDSPFSPARQRNVVFSVPFSGLFPGALAGGAEKRRNFFMKLKKLGALLLSASLDRKSVV